jgi:hypothetical protein
MKCSKNTLIKGEVKLRGQFRILYNEGLLDLNRSHDIVMLAKLSSLRWSGRTDWREGQEMHTTWMTEKEM